MSSKDDDKQIELDRYDLRATQALSQDHSELPPTGLSYLPLYLRTPYIFFDKLLIKQLKIGDRVLEIGAGSGQHTEVLVKSGADVTATDISPNSLKLLEQRIFKYTGKTVKTKVADMENLPFDENSFDYIICAGSLSYGDTRKVDNEISRVLSPGGSLICVDSLNHNWVYRFNRWIGYLRGNRSRSTIIRMPDLARIEDISDKFNCVNVTYYGAFSYIMPLLSKFIGEANAKNFSDYLDKLFRCKKSAFKFVLFCEKLNK